MTETNFYTWGGWGFVGTVAAISVPLLAYFYNSAKAQLEDGQDRARIRAELEGQTTAFQRYQSALSGFTARADGLFGPPWRFRAFERCFQIAMIYPISLLIVAWVLGMQGTIGPITLLPNLPIGRRVIAAVILTTTSVGMFIYLRNGVLQRFANWLKGWFFADAAKEQRNVPWLHEFVDTVAYAGAIAVSLVVVGASAVAGASTAALVVAVAGAGTVAVAVALVVAVAGSGSGFGASAVAGAVAGAVTVAVAATFTGSVAGTGVVALTIVIFVFLALLPMANATLDMMSWGITRTLLAKIDHGSDGARGLTLVIGALTIDVVVAMACLVGLVALTAMMLEAVNLLLTWRGIPEFGWKSQVNLARASPFSQGLLVTGMLATTLVPTVIHLTLGIGHAMTVWSPSAQASAALIHDGMPTSAKQAVARVMLYRKLWMLPAFVVVCLFGWSLFAAFSTWVEPFGLFLEQVAFASAGLLPKP